MNMTSNDGTLYDRGYRYTHLDSAGTTVVRSTATRLVRVNVNNHGTGGVVGVYNADSVSANQQVASIGAADPRNCGTLEFNVALSGGLTVDITGSPDITVIYC